MLSKPKKRPKNKVSNQWLAYRRKWVKENPPDHMGYYVCGICKRNVYYKEMAIDHIKDRSTAIELSYEPSNLQPTHYVCNVIKKRKGGV